MKWWQQPAPNDDRLAVQIAVYYPEELTLEERERFKAKALAAGNKLCRELTERG